MRLRRLAAALVGFVGLTLEIAYTRVVSFKLFYYYTYFVIGLALLGFGAAATVVALSRRLRERDVLDVIRITAPVVGVTGVLAYIVLAVLPTDVNQIWVGSWPRAIAELAVVVLLAILITVAFAGLGLVISLLIVRDAADVRSLYFWDLVGAALACLVAVPLQLTIGPPAMVATSLVLFALLGPLIARGTGRGMRNASIGTGVAVAVALGAVAVDVRADATKTLRPDSTVIAGDWGAVFRVDATPFFDSYVLHHDGLWGSAIWEYDGTARTTERFATDNRQFPWAVLGRTPDRILIIGAAGGSEIQAALTYGVGHVDAVELNPVTHELLTDTFAEYSGRITDRPDVDYIQGDGRTFLARSDHEYDLIWFVAPDSYAASNAATSGAFVLSESYLYTEEMIVEAFDHLAVDGLMVAQFGDFDFDTRPTRTARYLVTARSAIGDELGPFEEHVVLTVEDAELELARASTIIVSPSPIDAASVDRLAEAARSVPGTRIVSAPGRSVEPGLPAALIAADDAAGVERLVDDYAYDIASITDDRPFFWHFTPYRDVLTDFSRGLEDSEIAIGERLILMLLVVAALVAGVMLGLPFLVSRGGSAPVPGRSRLFVYFATLGFGFFVVEISMIQRFALLLGYPTLSLSVSLFTLLAATALGARWSEGVARRRGGLAAVVGLMWVVAIAYLIVSEPITDAVLAWSEPLRIAVVFALLFPVGMLLGMFLPAGIDRARELAAVSGADEGRLVAWCWAVNGFFSVIGSTATTMLSMTFGFDRTLVVGLVLYTAGVAVFALGRRAAAAIG